MVVVNFTSQALADIDNIASFISKNSQKYAKIQVQRFFERIEILEKKPLSGRLVPEINNKKIRELVMGNYRIIYLVVNKSRIDILTIHSSYMLLSNSPAFIK
jgi:toxin ParE1/3/4